MADPNDTQAANDEPEDPKPPFIPSPEQLAELEEVVPKPKADYLPDF